MAKNVYLKRYIEEGQRHCILNEANFKKMRPGYLIFADKCLTPIKDEDAHGLVRQNPHLLSLEPMSAAALKKAKKGNTRPSYSPDHVNRRILSHDLNEDETTSLELAAEDNLYKKPPKVGEPKTKAAATMTVEDVEITGIVKDVLATIAKMSDAEFNGMKLKDVRTIGETLGLKIPAVGIKTTDALKALNGRAAELMENVKSDDEDYEADE